MSVTRQDRADITDVCTRIMWTIDVRHWDNFRGVFAPEVILDYTGLCDRGTAACHAQEITKSWSALFVGYEATQHLLGNHLVTLSGDRPILTTVFQVPIRPDPHRRQLADRRGDHDPTWADGSKNVALVATAAAGN
jgi:hypothetical protein